MLTLASIQLGRDRTRHWTGTNFIVCRTSGLPRPASGRKRKRTRNGSTLNLQPCWKSNPSAKTLLLRLRSCSTEVHHRGALAVCPKSRLHKHTHIKELLAVSC